MHSPKMPPVEYHQCQVVGHGYRFIPAYSRAVTRMKKDVLAGYLVGVVVVWSDNLRTKYIDVNKEPHSRDRVYDMKEVPTEDEQNSVIIRLQEEYPLGDRVLMVDWEFKKGRMFPRPMLAPIGYQIPTIDEETWPENSAAEPASEVAAPLEVSLGEAARVSRKQGKKNRDKDRTEKQDET